MPKRPPARLPTPRGDSEDHNLHLRPAVRRPGAPFLICIEKVPGPTPARADTVIIDTLSSHKVAGVREAIEAVGARLIYLPPYSPDLNPIELAVAKFKKGSRTNRGCTR